MINFLGNFKDEEVSKYNVVIENEDGFVFYNQITGALLLYGKKEFEEYRKIIRGNFYVDGGFLNTLRENGFVKKKSFDEVSYMERKYQEIKHKAFNKQITIVPTDKCNLGCLYCYEDKSQWKNMSQETIDKTKTFIKVFLESSPTNRLHITWFGGEPTLNLSCIEEISSFVKDICTKNKIQLYQYMVSNGTNINEKVISRLKNIGIEGLQITVDGFKEDHDVSRPYLSSMRIEEMSEVQIEQRRKIEPNFGKFLNIIGQDPVQEKKRSTYDDIMRNLQLMHRSGFSISLRCNINSRNIRNHHKLLSHLKDLGLTDTHESGGIVMPYVSQIFNHEGNEDLRDMTRQEFSDFEMEVKTNHCGQTSATANLSHFSGESCTANKRYSFCVSQSGKLTKCWHHTSNENYIIGDVSNIELARIGFTDEFSPFKDAECLSCSVLPTCLGGCKEGNGFYETGYEEQKYHGCSTLRWNIRPRVNLLYQQSKKGTHQEQLIKIDVN
jgi:uncharacterized protein